MRTATPIITVMLYYLHKERKENYEIRYIQNMMIRDRKKRNIVEKCCKL